jgi:hypothetical protein
MPILAAAENTSFEEHPVLFVSAAAIMLLVLWQILWPRETDARPGGRFSLRRIGILNSAKLIVAAVSLIAATSEAVLLSIAAGACVIALVAWEAWWWRGRSRRD